MRKFYTILAAVLLTSSAVAQAKRLNHKGGYAGSRKEYVTCLTPDNIEVTQSNSGKTNLSLGFNVSPSAKSMWLWEQVIGYSTYDNQTNNSTQNRVIVDDNENVHSTWTMSFQENNTWTDRGTGYNSGQGYIWGEEPYDRIESERTGWPALIKLGSNAGEAIINHTGTGPLSIQKRSTIGSGPWTMSTIPSSIPNDILWPRAAIDGDTIHVIGLTAATGFDGTPLNNIDGNIVYFRSNDNGVTWSVQGVPFAQIDSTEYGSIESDSYAIDAENGRVSVALFSEFHDSMLLTSLNGGNDWTSTLFLDFPIAGYNIGDLTDIENDGIIDTIETTDGNGALIIDDNGVSHLTFGRYVFLDDEATDSLYTIFVTLELLYWNSTMATNEIYVIGEAQESGNDLDEDFTLDIEQVPDYRASMASMPTMAKDADGNVYVVYAAADEDFVDDQFFRHLYVTSTADGGTNWTDAIELTPDEDFDLYEYSFPTMARDVDDKLHIIVQRDNEPGLAVRGDLDSPGENDIVYLAVTTDFDLTIGLPEEVAAPDSFTAYPNPSSGFVTISGENLAGQSMKLFNQLGQEMLSTKLSKNFNANDRQTFDFSYLPAGKYTMTIGSGKDRMSKEILINK